MRQASYSGAAEADECSARQAVPHPRGDPRGRPRAHGARRTCDGRGGGGGTGHLAGHRLPLFLRPPGARERGRPRGRGSRLRQHRGGRGRRPRALAVSLYIFDLSLAHEAAFRQFLARNLDAWLSEGPRDRRGARRVEMFRRALAGAGLDPAREARLVAALTAATGTEAMIALIDIARVDPDVARETVAEIAEALLDRYGVTR